MNVAASHAEHAAGPTPRAFTNIWVALLALTGLEVLLAYLQFPTLIMLTALMGISIVKASLIIAWFMHLRFERLSLFLTLFPMLVFCIILMILIFLPDSRRLVLMRLGA